MAADDRPTDETILDVASDDHAVLPQPLTALLQAIEEWNKQWPPLGNFPTRGDYQEVTTLDEVICTARDSLVPYKRPQADDELPAPEVIFAFLGGLAARSAMLKKAQRSKAANAEKVHKTKLPFRAMRHALRCCAPADYLATLAGSYVAQEVVDFAEWALDEERRRAADTDATTDTVREPKEVRSQSQSPKLKYAQFALSQQALLKEHEKMTSLRLRRSSDATEEPPLKRKRLEADDAKRFLTAEQQRLATAEWVNAAAHHDTTLAAVMETAAQQSLDTDPGSDAVEC